MTITEWVSNSIVYLIFNVLNKHNPPGVLTIYLVSYLQSKIHLKRVTKKYALNFPRDWEALKFLKISLIFIYDYFLWG